MEGRNKNQKIDFFSFDGVLDLVGGEGLWFTPGYSRHAKESCLRFYGGRWWQDSNTPTLSTNRSPMVTMDSWIPKAWMPISPLSYAWHGMPSVAVAKTASVASGVAGCFHGRPRDLA